MLDYLRHGILMYFQRLHDEEIARNIKGGYEYWVYELNGKNDNLYARLKFAPLEYRDYNLCRLAVNSYGHSLEDVPLEHKDYRMCVEAVSNDKDAIIFVPEHLEESVKDYLKYEQLK